MQTQRTGVLQNDLLKDLGELPQQDVCKEGVLSEQQLCDQERNSSLDPEEPEPPQMKEEQEEPVSGQEGD
ncbi:putative zinc finger protein 135-like [Scophthalmus maximus]|uniref:Putative zinc finger protein 135-like n=1 Tax=Scophthalmus maximus TaxID=52904 RepID=A0A2U9BSW6_SCOMX|nr:putative zinc finger protein 135-like [Scophthalmus maximus]